MTNEKKDACSMNNIEAFLDSGFLLDSSYALKKDSVEYFIKAGKEDRITALNLYAQYLFLKRIGNINLTNSYEEIINGIGLVLSDEESIKVEKDVEQILESEKQYKTDKGCSFTS